MKRTKLAGAGAAAVGALTAATALLLGSTAAVADEQRPDSAWGLAATGVLQIDPIPYVESRDGTLVTDELIGIRPNVGPFHELSVDVLDVKAEDNLASAKVLDLNVLGLLKADVVDTWCVDGKGGLELVGGTVLGQPLPPTPIPNYELDLSPVAKLVLNDQKHNDDGTLTVTGIRLDVLSGASSTLADILGDKVHQLLPLPDSVQSIMIGSATCGSSGGSGGGAPGDGSSGDDGSGGDGDGSGGDGSGGDGDGSGGDGSGGDGDGDVDGGPLPAGVQAAPKPEIVKADLAVTG